MARFLRRGDDEHRRGRVDEALRWYDKALRIAYHPNLHYSHARSPLASSPDEFLQPLRSSELGALLLGPTPPATERSSWEPRERRKGDPIRLLVIAQKNWTFVEPVIEALEADGHFEVRRFEVNDLPVQERPSRERVLRARYDFVTSGKRLATSVALKEAHEWADSVLIEWGHHVLTWAPGSTPRPGIQRCASIGSRCTPRSRCSPTSPAWTASCSCPPMSTDCWSASAPV
ncbi:hypothetical protein QP589_09620 [Helcobacillus massiliensis]|nr:hypothetical protein [Helcobacillus massiliensis]